MSNRRMIVQTSSLRIQQRLLLPILAVLSLWLSPPASAFTVHHHHHQHFQHHQQQHVHGHATTPYRHHHWPSLSSSSWQQQRRLSSVSPSSSNNEKKKQQNKNPKKIPIKTRIQKAIKSLVAMKDRTRSRFLALPRRTKRLVMIQVFCMTCIFGGMARAVIRKSGYDNAFISSPPIEIPYSRFLDLVEQQKQQQQQQQSSLQSTTTTTGSSSDVPVVMDQVRIGTDRIVYRLYRKQDVVTEDVTTLADSATVQQQQQQQSSTSATAGTAGASSTAAAAAIVTTAPPIVTMKKILPGIYVSKTTTNNDADGSSLSTREQALLQIQQMRQNNNNKNRSRNHQQRPVMIRAYTRKVAASPQLLDSLRENDIQFSALVQPRQSVLTTSVRSVVVLFYFMILWRLYRTISGGGSGALGGKSDVPGKLASQTSDLPLASFEDIQGIDLAKQEVMELVDTLRHPEKYSILGARAPTGLLLEGAPGTGKTMLARATAASAGVPLLYCSGSDFVEMYVGRGAARVRRLFERAGKLAPCLIFIDELDALGKSRDATLGGFGMSRSNDEQEQTLNQLLACMDGLDTSRRICVMAATNRKEVLDPALIRPGRFDRIVRLELPNRQGRENILRVHCQKLPGFMEGSGVDPNRINALGTGRVVDLSAIAAVTEGFSGAELEFLVNEAAIRAVRRVSAALRANSSNVKAGDVITPHVEAADFEASLANFYQTRRSSSTGTMPDLFKNMFKS